MLIKFHWIVLLRFFFFFFFRNFLTEILIQPKVSSIHFFHFSLSPTTISLRLPISYPFLRLSLHFFLGRPLLFPPYSCQIMMFLLLLLRVFHYRYFPQLKVSSNLFLHYFSQTTSFRSFPHVISPLVFGMSSSISSMWLPSFSVSSSSFVSETSSQRFFPIKSLFRFFLQFSLSPATIFFRPHLSCPSLNLSFHFFWDILFYFYHLVAKLQRFFFFFFFCDFRTKIFPKQKSVPLFSSTFLYLLPLFLSDHTFPILPLSYLSTSFWYLFIYFYDMFAELLRFFLLFFF